MIEFRRDGIVLRLIRDRGEWDLVLGGPAADGCHDIEIWQAYLRNARAPSSGATPSLQQQADFVRDHLTQIDDALKTDAHVAARLLQLGRQRSDEMYGVPRDQSR
jgi:hypothetical protein